MGSVRLRTALLLLRFAVDAPLRCSAGKAPFCSRGMASSIRLSGKCPEHTMVESQPPKRSLPITRPHLLLSLRFLGNWNSDTPSALRAPHLKKHSTSSLR
uniref:Putative secreted protein n=1 Tax=Ixodes ricinus TaxID=34613 RepID=A0A6B0UEP8_IXORI